jgi:hypothetical protein
LNQTNDTTENNTLTNLLINGLAYGTYNWSVGCTDDSDNENITDNRTLNLIYSAASTSTANGATGTASSTVQDLGTILPGTYKDASLSFGDTATFTSYGNQHTIRVSGIFGSTGTLEISSDTFKANFKVGEPQQYDTNGNGINDLEITLLSKTDTTVDIRIKALTDAVVTPTVTTTPTTPAVQPFCGDGICNNGENFVSCAADCPLTTAMFAIQGGSLTTFAIFLIFAAVIYVIWQEAKTKRKKK